MKKYQQLVLLIFSFISLILVLVYRREYNRLHYVLEVFNFFGTPCNFSGLNTSDTYPYHFDWGQNPIWQEHDDYYVFSGFTNGYWTKALVVNKKGSKPPKKCYLWFEKKTPMLGEMSVTALSETDGVKAYIYNCGSKYSKILPYAVSFGSRSKYSSSKKTILSAFEKTSYSVKAALCVLPSAYDKRQLIEFISFHKLIGFKYFIFYYDDLPYNLLKMLSTLSEIVDIDFTFFPWNSPFESTNSFRKIIEEDCLLRTFVKSKTSITLALNEFLIPLYSYSIHPYLEDNSHLFDYMNIPVQTICIQTNHSYLPVVIQNTNSHDDDDSLKTIKFNFNKKLNETKLTSDNSANMVVQAYKYCDGKTDSFRESKFMKAYSTDLIRSTLMQLFHDGQI